MSIVRVEYPAAGGSAVFPDDYNLQNDLIAAIIAQGDNALKLTEWDSSGTVPAVKLGVYIRHNGTYYLVTSSDEAISGTPTDVKQNYVKLTPAGGGATLAASWVDEDNISGYSYDFTKDGWYDASDNQILEEFLYRDGSVYTNRKYRDKFAHINYYNQDGSIGVIDLSENGHIFFPPYGNVGTLVTAASTAHSASTEYLPGTEVAGSTLVTTDGTGISSFGFISEDFSYVNTGFEQNLGLTGTWRLLSRVYRTSNAVVRVVGLWQRIL